MREESRSTKFLPLIIKQKHSQFMKNKPKPNSNTLLFIMKITLINVLLTSVTIVFGYALDSNGQEVLNQKVSLQVENAKIKDVLSVLEQKAGVRFTYRPRILKNLKDVSLSATEMQLRNVLSELFDESIKYEVIGKQIVLKENSFEVLEAGEVARPIPTFTVTGKIADETGVPLPGVNVIEKGTTNGTTSDVDGHYTIIVADANATLVFSFIGYTTQEIPVGGRSSVDVSFLPDVSTLQEVVVVGYGEQKKVTVTGAVTAVNGTELQKSPAVDLSNSLAGRLPGVVAIQASGEPGYDQSTIRIRGIGTLGNSNALIVIDGIPDRDGGFGRLSPQDIESMSVLKDASAAIYGARAANGVILITTKRGKTGTPKISYDFNQGWSQATRIPKMANASEYAAIMNEFPVYTLKNPSEWSAGWAGIQQNGTYTSADGTQKINSNFSPADVQKYKDGSDPWGHPNTDWFGTAFKTWAPQSRHNLQLSGGTENVKYLSSIGYVNQDAYYKNSATSYQQYNFRINLDAKVNKYINTSLGIMAREEVRNFPTQSAGSIFRMLMRGRPTDPEVWPNGLPGPDIENGQNPIVVTTNATGYQKNPTDYLQTNGKVEITNPWIEGLKLTLIGSADKSINRNKVWETPWYLYTWDKTSYEADGVTPLLTKSLRSTFTDPRLTQSTGTVFNTNTTALLNFDRTFSNDHTIGVMVGTTREKFTGDFFQAYRRDYISSAIDQPFAGGTTQLVSGGNDNRYTYNRARIGYYGRVTYNYREKYLLEVVGRRDGSSIFPPSHRYGFFPGVLVGWNLSNESFMENLRVVNLLKIRASYGQMGNDQVYYNDKLQEYAYLSAYASGSYPINGQVATTVYEQVVANPNFTWEVAKNSNIGLDGTLFNGKLDFSLNYFYNKRDQISIQKTGSTPASSGITALLPPVNTGRVDNAGYDFRFNYNAEAAGVKYSIGFNGGYAKNKVVFMDEVPGAPAYQLQTGKPYGAYLAYKADGAFKTAQEVSDNAIDYSAVTPNLRPGDLKFVDVNKDGKINGDDQVRLDKTITPTFSYGMTMNVQFKNFDLSVLFQGASGALLRFGTESGDIGNYLKYSYDHRWSVDNPSSTYPRLATRGDTYYTGGNYGNNTYNLYSTNYLRLKNVELGYNVPVALSTKVGLSAVRFYVNGLNLVTWDKFKIWDPESTSGSGQYYPQPRIMNVGFRLTF
jgi:TonB-linked SusC/RagA family outer membrane protein